MSHRARAADGATDLSAQRIEAAVAVIDRPFRDSPQFVNDRLCTELGRRVVLKVETLNPIGSFKGRGTSLLAATLDASKPWICSTAGNFGQGLAYAARSRGARIEIFVAPDVAAMKVAAMRALGAHVRVSKDAEGAAREHANQRHGRLIVDGLHRELAEGAGTIALELAHEHQIDAIIVQIGDGALISGVACWLRHVTPDTRIIGVCARGAPAMARSFRAGTPIATSKTSTIATALAVSRPIPESVARVCALVDEVVLVDDDELIAASALLASTLGVLIEPSGAAGVAAIPAVSGDVIAVVLTGAR